MVKKVKDNVLKINSIKTLKPFKNLKASSDLHLQRRIWHMASGVAGLLYYLFSGISPIEMSNMLLTLGAVVFLIETLRLRSEKFNDIVLSIMGPLMREKERNRISGFVYYAFGVALTLRFFDESLALISCIFLIFSDPLSSMAGICYGKRKLWQGKTLEGSLAGVAVCFTVTFIYSLALIPFSWNLVLFCLFAGVIGSLAELCTFFVDDNFVIPLLSGFGLTLLNTYFGFY